MAPAVHFLCSALNSRPLSDRPRVGWPPHASLGAGVQDPMRGVNRGENPPLPTRAAPKGSPCKNTRKTPSTTSLITRESVEESFSKGPWSRQKPLHKIRFRSPSPERPKIRDHSLPLSSGNLRPTVDLTQ